MVRPVVTTPLIIHVMHWPGIDGLGSSEVNLISGRPTDRYRHVIVCMQGCTSFYKWLKRYVDVCEMTRQNGHDLGLYLRLFRIFRQLWPAVVRARNLLVRGSEAVRDIIDLQFSIDAMTQG
jgi:hypothetical protein